MQTEGGSFRFSSWLLAISYTVALVAYRTQQRVNLDAIWEEQTVSEPLSTTIQSWMPLVQQGIIDSCNGRLPSEWCKKPECWRHVQMMDLSLPSELEEELAEGQPLPNVGQDGKKKDLELTAQDRENIAKVMLVSDEEWLQIHKWGINTGNLQEFEAGIAHTFVAYAANGWSKVPSRKQARWGVEIIEKARGNVPTLELV